jgi:carbon starvation protein
MLKKALWLTVSVVAAFALSVVAGFVPPSEKINALWLIVAAGCFYALTYRFYAAFIAVKVLSPGAPFYLSVHLTKAQYRP